jgi:glutamate-1-semialdehyde 2,1-aminomutase
LAGRENAVRNVRGIDPVAGGCSTTGKLPLDLDGHPRPGRAVAASGACFRDDEGVVWLDFDMALGSVVWGHGREDFADAIRDALLECDAASVPTVLERDAALALLERLDRYEQVRFLKSGSDACSAAVRIARAAVGRSAISTDGYHGWHDWSVARAYPDEAVALGILPEVKAAVHLLDPAQGVENALAMLESLAAELAAVIVRPEAWSSDALAQLALVAREFGALLIFDEVTSHFKYGRTGVAGAIGLWPDLLCVSKGLANGLPLAAVLGSERVMRHAASARISTTYATESTALAALLLGEQLLADVPEWPSWRRPLGEVVEKVHSGLRRYELTHELRLVAHPGFFSIERAGIPFKSDPLRYHVAGMLADRGIFSRGWFHGSDRHTAEDWDRLAAALESALRAWASR